MKNLNMLLSKVQKPGRYIGEEINMVKKEWDNDRTKFALVYPDLYEVGMSYLGLKLLYHLLNDNDNIICERAFAPELDMQSELKTMGQRLFSLETKRSLCDFDIIGFSLSYELNFTNVLNVLSLGGVTVQADKRGDDEPIVIAGGACCFNPEPMSDFIDVFIIGEAEESILIFIERFRELKKNNISRKEILLQLSKLEGVYVPSLYVASYTDNKFSALNPKVDGVPLEINKSVVKDFENAYYPLKQIVPFIRIVHDRLTVEIMRGCPNKCRFCQANTINRPVRIRSIEKIREIAKKGYELTGYEQIALLSLSSVDYPRITELISKLKNDFPERIVSFSVPSLRIDEAFYDLPEIMSAIKKAGLTFAPETANDDLREALGKDIHMSVLCKSVRLAYEHGWRRVKLYFMVGFPGEKKEEVTDIVNVSRKISNLRKDLYKSAADVKVSVNAFVPKSHTALQWVGMKSKEDLFYIREALMQKNSKKIQISVMNIFQAELEAAIARGDRRLGKVILSAWENGAFMDGTLDHFKHDIWADAFKEHNLSIDQFARADYLMDDPLPWDHIVSGVSKETLKKELLESGLYRRKT